MELQPFAQYKAELDLAISKDPAFEIWLFSRPAAMESAFYRMHLWLREQALLDKWQQPNWTNYLAGQARAGSIMTGGNIMTGVHLDALKKRYLAQKKNWARQIMDAWQQRLKRRYIAAWHLERTIPAHMQAWDKATECPCPSVPDPRCRSELGCANKRLAAGYHYDKDGKLTIRKCFTVPETTPGQMQAINRRYTRRYQQRSYQERGYLPFALQGEEAICTDRDSYALMMQAVTAKLTLIKDDQSIPSAPPPPPSKIHRGLTSSMRL